MDIFEHPSHTKSRNSFPEVKYSKLKPDEEKGVESRPPTSPQKTLFSKCLSITSSITGVLYVLSASALFLVCACGALGYFGFISNDNNTSRFSSGEQCSSIENNRFDCWPERVGASQNKCEARGCCWKPASKPNTAPFCFFPSNYSGYSVKSIHLKPTGVEATLERSTKTFFSEDVMTLKLDIEFQTNERLRIKFYDPNNERYEVPLNVPSGSAEELNPKYKVIVEESPFNLVVTRASTGAVLFDTRFTAPLIFSDQYIQIATTLSTKYLYGLGEHRSNFLQDLSTWRRLVFWNRDSSPAVDNNGYGTHPFYVNLEKGKDEDSKGKQNNTHGVFLLNSNAGEVSLQPYGRSGAITYRSLGGILDFFVFLGPEAAKVVSQYADVIGRPYFPPFWSLGFQLCKYGVKTADDLSAMIRRNRASEMPYDVQWSDIDYMHDHRDWTVDPVNYAHLPEVVKDLHDNDQKYIIMADPAISSEQPSGSYPPFDDGKNMDVFIKNATGQILIGKVWPGLTAYPDFFHPRAYNYWYQQAKEFHDKIPFDGLWIDMNEPSSFIDGSVAGCPDSKYNTPPYLPPTLDGNSLVQKTICPSAKQTISEHYNVHNMYGWSQANVTRAVLKSLFPGKRTPMITRSSFAGSNVFTGHWLGDNHSGYDEMFYTIPGILNFNLFGFPQIGADICGFGGQTTPELCTRWHQLGVFYPFMRNHAAIDSAYQDPASFDVPHRDYIRSALQLRYKLLSVLYNGFYLSHVYGLPLVRPLFFMYPGTEAIDTQFMWLDQLMISPVLDKGQTVVDAFIPNDTWYDFYNGTQLQQVDQTVRLDAPIDRINVHVKGGSILTLLPPTVRTVYSQMERFILTVAPDAEGLATGFLFWDDGESEDTISNKRYTLVEFYLKDQKLTSVVKQAATKASLGNIQIFGVQSRPTRASVNGVNYKFIYSQEAKVFTIPDLAIDLLDPLTVEWSLTTVYNG